MSKILVIDDEEWICQMIRMALTQRGYEILEAGGGDKGLELARKELPDLVICDVNMQPMNGYATLREMRAAAATAAIPFILMTGAADNAGMRQGMELGADDYLPKPFTLDALYAAVEARLKKAQTLRAEAEKKLADLRDNISLMLPHELRTPLNGILAYGEILRTDAQSLTPQEIAEMGQVIAESGMRLQRLIENFLIYAQIEILEADPQKVAALRAGCTDHPEKLIRSHAVQQAERPNRISDLVLLDISDQPAAISENYLSKIVDELVNNALKYSQPGSPVRISLTPEDRTMVLTITDQGRGMDAEQIRKMGAYMQFERKLHEQQGLGLGLIISQRLANIHGGRLTIQSRKSQGTTVTVRVPMAPTVANTSPAPAMMAQSLFPMRGIASAAIAG
jgi:two-component system sensor histidine kinase/response regulator